MAYIGRTTDGFGVRSRFIYTATGGQTTFNTDDSSNALSYSDGAYVDVYLNGVLLDPADYTATSLTSIVLGSGATASDILEVIVYDVFSVFSGTFTNGITASTATVTGDLTGVNATFTTTDNSDNLTLTSTDADASSGPNVKLYRNSASPADGDALGFINFYGENDADEETLYGQIRASIADASDGTEDARFIIQTAVAGTQQTSRVELTGTETVVNEDSKDLDFRVESDNNTHALFVQGSDGNVGVGTVSPDGLAHIYNGMLQVGSKSGDTSVQQNANAIRISAVPNSSTEWGGLQWYREFSDVIGAEIIASRASSAETDTDLIFKTSTNSSNAVEVARLEHSGNLLVGKTSNSSAVAGAMLFNDGRVFGTKDGNYCAQFNRLTSDGSIIQLRKDGTTVGAIGSRSGVVSFIVLDPRSGGSGLSASGRAVLPANESGATVDNTIDLGDSGSRFDDIFATNGNINQSDQNEKQDIASLTDTEITAAKAISKLFKTFKWKDKVASKGDSARTHSGVIAQEVQSAMTDAGLDATKYAFWCSDTWWETQTEVPAVEAVEAKDAVLDGDGNLVSDAVEAVEAKDAYTRTDIYNTADEAPEGATERTRLGIRYSELLAFIGAATEQRLADIETRLTALESA